MPHPAPRGRSRATSARPRQTSAAQRARRRRAVRRGRVLALAALVAIAAGVALIVDVGSTSPPTAAHRTSATGPGRTRPAAQYAVGLSVMRLVDDTRSVSQPGGTTVPRPLLTYVRYPALGPASLSDVRGAPPARAAGPFPLIVFGHGFAVTPALYAPLLRAWTRAGYVVAAPLFPLTNANAPGGASESDLPNQPADLSVVTSRMLTADGASSGPLRGLIAPREIAVTGHSDGGDSALAVAYDPRYRDPRMRAAIILSGAEIPGIGGFQIMPGGPPLLAVQGSADTINPPSETNAFYDSAPGPKYRLELRGASHLGPYSSQEPQLGVVERATIAFLDTYLKHIPGAQQRLLRAGAAPRTATLDAGP